ncbi:hypothetical protein [Paenibacillus mucilaginosus]|uniref:hypothetical protein n=1 Tax=Paenibacillus mucilaginosus TaxID=61624 RepID=UPI00117D72C4|nr:hypothetical protein [Paenibacillus mucilaginosus]MCG7217374.1 hypothetical protein [Paenibacillus mucilaginosus]WDM29057.1 hypothetical protein KCX80_07785 [Paenibacillus mucilaginosus]
MKKKFKILASSVLAFSLMTGAAYAAEPTVQQSVNTQTVQPQLLTRNYKVGEFFTLTGWNWTSSNPGVVGMLKWRVREAPVTIFRAAAPGDTIISRGYISYQIHVTE